MALGRRSFATRCYDMGLMARDVVGRVVDACVYTVNPEAGAKRMVIRKIVSESERRTSAREDDRDNGDRLHGPQRWMWSRLSADSALEQDLDDRRHRSLELYRDTTAGGAIDTKVNHVVGRGFTYRPKIVEQPGISKEAADGWNKQLLDVHNRWSRCCDLTGTMSLWELHRLQARSFAYAGESFTVMWAKRRPSQPIPLVLEVVDPERVSTPPDKIGDPLCRLGIQYAADGEIIGYWVRTTEPFDTLKVEYKWNLIPAAQMLHVLERWFPKQSRGYPWMQRTLERQRDGEDLDEAGIIAAQVEACNAAFVKTKEPLKAAAGAGRQSINGRRLQDMRPGTINYLDHDAEDVLFNTPTKSNIVGTLYTWNYRRIAAGMDWAYEFLLKDWTGVSFAGGRLILSGVKVTCGVEQKLHDVAWLSKIADEMTSQAVLFGAVDINVAKFQQRPWVYQAHRWTPPKWEYALNPGEEISAKIDAVENNMMTLEDAVGEEGEELDEVLDQRAVEVQRQESLGIVSAARLAAMGQMGKDANKVDAGSKKKPKSAPVEE